MKKTIPWIIIFACFYGAYSLLSSFECKTCFYDFDMRQKQEQQSINTHKENNFG